MKNKQEDLVFDKRQTNIFKGIALLILLWHHLFPYDTTFYDKFVSVYYLGDVPIESIFSIVGKICVSMFLMVSGYGVYKSYESYYKKLGSKKPNIKDDFIFVKNRLIKLLSSYWIIYIVFVPMGFFLGRNPVQIYQGNIFYMLLDILGLADMFKVPTMDAAWWFMSLIILFYVLFPIIYRLFNYSAELVLLVSFAICIIYLMPNVFFNFRHYSFPFIFGMYLSKYNVLTLLSRKFNSNILRILICFVASITILFIKRTMFINSIDIDAFFAFVILLTSFFIVSKIPVLNKILEALGKTSGSIFMFQTFIFPYYFNDFIYGFKYSLVIFIVTVVLCYLIAILLSWLMKVTRYNKLISKIT